MDVLLINRDDIMKLTGVNGNIDFDKIMPHVKTAQDVYLRQKIGLKLLNKLKDLVESGDINKPAFEDYKKLLDEHITPTLVFTVMVDFLPFLSYETANGGTFQNDGQNATPVNVEILDRQIKKYADYSHRYGQIMIDYIYNNRGKYPEYFEGTKIEQKANGDEPFVGWVL